MADLDMAHKMTIRQQRKKAKMNDEVIAPEEPIKGGMTVAEAGRRGGMRTAVTHDIDFYKTIGHIGELRVKELIELAKRA